MPRVQVKDKLAELAENEFLRAEEKLKGTTEDAMEEWRLSGPTQALIHLLEHNILNLDLAWREGTLYQRTLPTYDSDGRVIIPGDPDAEKKGLYQLATFEELLNYIEDMQDWFETLKEEQEDDAAHRTPRPSETMPD